jgi:hypothetical protein
MEDRTPETLAAYLQARKAVVEAERRSQRQR